MVSNPTEVYQAALARRAAREEEASAEAARTAAFPQLADARLKSLCDVLEAKTPPGLSLEFSLNTAGGLGAQGLRGLLGKVMEKEEVVAQFSINCGKDELVHRTAHASQKAIASNPNIRKDYKLNTKKFNDFTDDDAIDLLSNTIAQYV